MRTAALTVVLGLGLFVARTASSAPVTFSNRENVNVLNSDTVVFAVSPSTVISGTGNANQLVGNHWASGETFLKGPNNGSNIALTFDFGAGTTRNVKTIRTWDEYGGYSITGALVETSPDGSTWSTAASGFAANVDNTTITLTGAADTRFLRVTGTGYQAHNQGLGNENWWGVGSVRVYGGTGTLAPGAHIDLIAASGFGSTSAVTVTAGNGASYTATNNAAIADDLPVGGSLLGGTIVYSMPVGGTVDIKFNQNIDFARFGFIGRSATANETFSIVASTDGGVTFPAGNTLYSGSSGFAMGPNYFDLTVFTGNALRFQVTGGTTRPDITDFFVFQNVPVPEPASLSLLALGALALLRRRK